MKRLYDALLKQPPFGGCFVSLAVDDVRWSRDALRRIPFILSALFNLADQLRTQSRMVIYWQDTVWDGKEKIGGERYATCTAPRLLNDR